MDCGRGIAGAGMADPAGALGQPVEHHPANVVARLFISLARITQADNDLHLYPAAARPREHANTADRTPDRLSLILRLPGEGGRSRTSPPARGAAPIPGPGDSRRARMAGPPTIRPGTTAVSGAPRLRPVRVVPHLRRASRGRRSCEPAARRVHSRGCTPSRLGGPARGHPGTARRAAR